MKLTHASASLEMKDFKAPTEGADEDSYTLSGYASIFGNTDLDGDIIERGAFRNSLKSRDPLFLVNHKMSELPVGKIIECHEDEKGLYFEAKMPKDDALVRDRLAPQLRAGSLKGVSIGFRTLDSEPIKGSKQGGRRIKQAELFEISVVNIPANPVAAVAAMKSLRHYDPLPVVEHKGEWDEAAALERVKAHTECGSSPSEAFGRAFLVVEDGDWDGHKHLIADVVGDQLKVNSAALFKAAGDIIASGDDDLKAAVREQLDTYYDALQLPSPFEALTAKEFDALTPRQREGRLRALGLTPGLAKSLAGHREGGRHRREGGPSVEPDIKTLLDEVRQLTKAIAS